MPATNYVLANNDQYPLNVVGPKGQYAFLGSHKVFFVGTGGGQVGTSFGIPNVTAQAVGSGIYQLNFPKVPNPRGGVDIYPSVEAPTGVYQIQMGRVNGASGVAQFKVTSPTGTGFFAAPTGTVGNFLFFVSPINRF